MRLLLPTDLLVHPAKVGTFGLGARPVFARARKAQRGSNRPNDIVCTRQHVDLIKEENPESGVSVASDTIASGGSATYDFDSKLVGKCREARILRPNPALSDEGRAELLSGNARPKVALSQRGIFAQLVGRFVEPKSSPLRHGHYPQPVRAVFIALAAMLASISTPSLAQQPPAAATRFEGPVPSVQDPSKDSTFASAVRQQAEACGMQNDSLQVTHERFSVEPATEAEEAALDARVEAISARSGATGPKESRQASRAFIRALLTQRLRLMLFYTGEDGEAGMACLVDALAEAGFAPVDPPGSFTQGQADAISDACGADRRWIVVQPGGEVHFSPPMDADYEVSVCLLKRLKESGATKLGFVGSRPVGEGESDD